MQHLSTVLSLMIGIAGWYYLFYSRAAEKLAAVESHRLNRLRVWLRRAGGVVLLLLAPVFFAGFHTVDPRDDPQAFVGIWVCVMALLGVNVLLALVDVGLTWKLRRQRLAAHRSQP
jgi:drug/metabolite transporter (DMT)-like permease